MTNTYHVEMQKDELFQPIVTSGDQAQIGETEMEYLETACNYL